MHTPCLIAHRGSFALLTLSISLLICPIGSLSDFLNRDCVRASNEERAPYARLDELIKKHCSGADKIYFISEGSTGFEYWVTRFNALPNAFSDNFSWSLGSPQYEGDVWTIDVSVDDWKKILLEGRYTHIAIYTMNEYFRENYSSVFSDSSTIYGNALYSINNETGLYELCE